jgi:multidrug efflux pump subunit AcrB
MNSLVLIALKRPYTFVVLAILIVIFGGRAVPRTPTDIFPNIGIPVVAVVWNYNGLTPEDMSGRVVYYYERALTTTVNNIEHIESQSLYGSGIIKNLFSDAGRDLGAVSHAIEAVLERTKNEVPHGAIVHVQGQG